MIHSPIGSQVRDAIHQSDRNAFAEARAVYTNSNTVANRLIKHLALEAQTLYHPPPHSEQLRCGEPEEYFFFPSRISPIKRQSLVVQALAHTSEPVRVRFVGAFDFPPMPTNCRRFARSTACKVASSGSDSWARRKSVTYILILWR
jgi:hypothetical protein